MTVGTPVLTELFLEDNRNGISINTTSSSGPLEPSQLNGILRYEYVCKRGTLHQNSSNSLTRVVAILTSFGFEDCSLLGCNNFQLDPPWPFVQVKARLDLGARRRLDQEMRSVSIWVLSAMQQSVHTLLTNIASTLKEKNLLAVSQKHPTPTSHSRPSSARASAKKCAQDHF